MTATATTLNGFDLAALQATVQAVRENPEAGRVTFRGRTVWAGGPAGDGRAEEMEQLGHVTQRQFTARGDHPPALLGRDTGPTAGEALLAALGSCLTATYASHATAHGVPLHALEVSVAGELDLGGFLQTGQTRAGFRSIQAVIRVRAEADEATLADVCRVTTQASPVFDTVSRGVPVTASVERLPDGGSR
jgi:uncharacterized OsmC-like protein